MIEKTVEISLPLLLPENQDACDHCVERLQTRLQDPKRHSPNTLAFGS